MYVQRLNIVSLSSRGNTSTKYRPIPLKTFPVCLLVYYLIDFITTVTVSHLYELNNCSAHT
jgi:hypothetical protein